MLERIAILIVIYSLAVTAATVFITIDIWVICSIVKWIKNGCKDD